jgi:methylthioribulose-1-phosphate dehydratase
LTVSFLSKEHPVPRIIRRRSSAARFRQLARELAVIGRDFHARGWNLGTSGNLSSVVATDPLRLAITASGLDKGALSPSQILEIDAEERVLAGRGKPSSETTIHLAIVRKRSAGAVLHTHSVWSTLLSQQHAHRGGIELHGYEMLKGLQGILSHEHTEWLPIVGNSQDMRRLSEQIESLLEKQPSIHGLLLRGHGLYTWGSDLAEAKRHVEIFEFLLEVFARSAASQNGNLL